MDETGTPFNGIAIDDRGEMTVAGDIFSNGVEQIGISSGTTAQRPTTPVPGFRYNTDTASYEAYKPSLGMWVAFASSVDIAAVGTIAILPEMNGSMIYADPNFSSASCFAFGIAETYPDGFSVELVDIGGSGNNATIDFTRSDKVYPVNFTGEMKYGTSVVVTMKIISGVYSWIVR